MGASPLLRHGRTLTNFASASPAGEPALCMHRPRPLLSALGVAALRDLSDPAIPTELRKTGPRTLLSPLHLPVADYYRDTCVPREDHETEVRR